jgi:hypothetical protein
MLGFCDLIKNRLELLRDLHLFDLLVDLNLHRAIK